MALTAARQFALTVLLALALLPLAGCIGGRAPARSQAGTAQSAPPSQSEEASPADRSSRNPATRGQEERVEVPEAPPHPERRAEGEGITVRWQEKGRDGRVRRVLEMVAERGSADIATQSGSLKVAKGILFRDGKPRTNFQAPTVEAYRDKNLVIARGGVTMWSIDPAGTTLTADEIRWEASRNLVFANGNVTITHIPKGATKPLASGAADRATFNTELQTFTIP